MLFENKSSYTHTGVCTCWIRPLLRTMLGGATLELQEVTKLHKHRIIKVQQKRDVKIKQDCVYMRMSILIMIWFSACKHHIPVL